MAFSRWPLGREEAKDPHLPDLGRYRAPGVGLNHTVEQRWVSCGIAYILLVMLLASTLFAGVPAVQRISEDEARNLLQEALKENDASHTLKLSLLGDLSKDDNRFFYFQGYFDTEMPNNASPILGNFAVNRWTGDVYSFDRCR